MRAVLMFLMLSGSALACAEPPREAQAPQQTAVLDEHGLTPAQQAAYRKCLDDSMAVAMAWEAIERQCLERVSTGGIELAPLQ